MKCAYCHKPLPEPNNTKVIIAVGLTGRESEACIACCKKQGLKIVRLEDGVFELQ